MTATPATAVLATADDLRARIRRAAQPKGRQPDETALAEVAAVLGPVPAGGYARDLLIEQLHRLNDAVGALREPHLVALAKLLNRPMAEVAEVASFYHHFAIVPAGAAVPELVVRVCDGLSCSLAGAQDLLARLPALLGRAVKLEPAPCIGRCEQAPAVAVHQQVVVHATPAAVAAKAAEGRAACSAQPPQAGGAFEPAALAQRAVTRGDEGPPTYTPLATYRAGGGYALPAGLAAGRIDPETVLQALEHAGLRGLGGAGFPAGRKWRIVRGQPGPRWLAVNIDEGEPGTFKDRTWLERDPHRFLEGVLVAAQVVGCDDVVLYLRDEYHQARVLLQQELAALAADPPCPLPRIQLRRGAGAYVCGEESAMLESIEGRRGEPRLRPPYIAQVGLFGRPTLAHNLETLYWVRDIVARGPQWFAGFGRHGRTGLRAYSVSGRVREPGVKLAPAGITVRELVAEYCGGMADGHQLYAYLPGGASGGILPASLADVPLDFDTLQPHGCFIGSAAVVVLSQHDRARDAALNVMRFLAHESCGQCTPCRVGTDKAARLMEAPRWDTATLGDLATVMADASICGLGQAAPNPIRCVTTHFPHEI
jgi:formate dehydrogenase